ncbi:607_t:CDS:2 [Entrophospora sp. SA101]|nr:607_t:CDS:2 [Entrophospora sp. SA101]
MVTTNMEIDEIKILRESSLHNNNQDNNNSIDSNKYNSKINSKKYDGYDRNQYWNYNEYYFSHDFGIFSDNVDVKRPALPKQNKPTTKIAEKVLNVDKELRSDQVKRSIIAQDDKLIMRMHLI